MSILGSDWVQHKKEDRCFSIGSDCRGPCLTCKINYLGGCLAGHGDDGYVHATQKWIAKHESKEKINIKRK